jgi:2'-5' RNA ligase
LKRLFIAVDLGPLTRDHADRAIDSLKNRVGNDRHARESKVSWVSAPRLHLTLHFLGGVDDERAVTLAEAMATPLPFRAFEMTVGEVGAFPETGPPRVIWLGIPEGGERLRDLHDMVAERLRLAGQGVDARHFHPHLTIARIRHGGRSMVKAIRSVSVGVSQPTLVDHVTLYESHLSPHGSRYEVLVRTAFLSEGAREGGNGRAKGRPI